VDGSGQCVGMMLDLACLLKTRRQVSAIESIPSQSCILCVLSEQEELKEFKTQHSVTVLSIVLHFVCISWQPLCDVQACGLY